MTVPRRQLLLGSALAPVAIWTAPPVWAKPGMPPILPRSAWAGTLKPRGSLVPETDIRFLLIHHTLTPNDDTPTGIPARIRSVYRYHTSAEKGWHDVAYNFFVDRFGIIWEGRQGSIEKSIRGDATGGFQGFAELACFIGDHTDQPPTEEALVAMTSLLAWLAGRDGLTMTGPTTFISRGSNRWRRGTKVTTQQIAGHRDMSNTECPGDALYPLITERLLPQVRELISDRTHTPTPKPTLVQPVEKQPNVPVALLAPEAVRWGGGALTTLGVAGVALSLVKRNRDTVGAEPLASGDNLHKNHQSAGTEGGQQTDEEEAQVP